MKIHGILMAVLVLVMLGVPASADDSQESFNSAGALYSQSVDLANEGKYEQALSAADRALALNVSSMNGLVQSNRAGILVMLHRYDDAVAAADAALAIEGNLTAVHSIAWYNRGNALRAQGKITEAQASYDRAFALDNTLVPPDMSGDVPVAGTPVITGSPTEKTAAATTQQIPVSPTGKIPVIPTTKSPLPVALVITALGIFSCMAPVFRK